MWLFNCCIPREEEWIGTLVKGMTDDSVGAAEMYIDCDGDRFNFEDEFVQIEADRKLHPVGGVKTPQIGPKGPRSGAASPAVSGATSPAKSPGWGGLYESLVDLFNEFGIIREQVTADLFNELNIPRNPIEQVTNGRARRAKPTTAPITDVVLWREIQRGSPQMFALLYRIHCTYHKASAEAGAKTDPTMWDQMYEAFVDYQTAAVAGGIDGKSQVPIPPPPPPKPFVKKVEPVEVVQHRRIRKHKHEPFVSSLVCEIKCKLGIPRRTPANILTVRHMAQARCREMNLRVVDSRRAVELVVTLVFVPDEVDVDAAKVANSVAVRKQHAALAYEKKSPWFRWIISMPTYVFFAWPQDSGQADA